MKKELWLIVLMVIQTIVVNGRNFDNISLFNRTTKMVVEGGKGKLWIDDVEIGIDSFGIWDIDHISPRLYPANEGREFDKASEINYVPPNREILEGLRLLGLIWGYLKYYHPAVAEGRYNWDYELFRLLPDIVGAKSEEERDGIFVRWLEKLGDFEMTNNSVPQKVKMEPDLCWIESSFLSDKLVELLIKVRNAKRRNEHFYIGMDAELGNPVFKNENSYSFMKYPDAGFRLLALFRYWNIINYFFPYKYLIEEDWKEVLSEFIPEFVNAKDETDYTLTVLKLIARINDTHANIYGNEILDNFRGLRCAPVEITFIDNKAVVTGLYQTRPAYESSLSIGDEIVSINQKSVEAIIEEELKITPASNFPSQLLLIAVNLLRTNEKELEIVYNRGEVLNDIKLNTFPLSNVNVTNRRQKQEAYFRLLSARIGYLYPGSIKNENLPTIWEKLNDTDGLIIDLRCYPSDYIVFSLSDYLMPKDKEFVKFTTGSLAEPGYFTFTDSLSVGRDNPDYYKGRVVILVNELTLSQAEYSAMAFRIAPEALVIGSTTGGADGNVSQFSLPGGINTLITGIGVYYPDGGETHGIGIVPDIIIKPTIEGIKEGRDELIEAAIEIIKNKNNENNQNPPLSPHPKKYY